MNNYEAFIKTVENSYLLKDLIDEFVHAAEGYSNLPTKEERIEEALARALQNERDLMVKWTSG